MEEGELKDLIRKTVREAIHEALGPRSDNLSAVRSRFRSEVLDMLNDHERRLSFESEKLSFNVNRLEMLATKLGNWAPTECKFNGCESVCRAGEP